MPERIWRVIAALLVIVEEAWDYLRKRKSDQPESNPRDS